MIEEKPQLDFFSKYLTIWVAVCIILGTALGYFFPQISKVLGGFEVANVSIPVAFVLLVIAFSSFAGSML